MFFKKSLLYILIGSISIFSPLVFSSCASSEVGQYVEENAALVLNHEPVSLPDRTDEVNINGYLPNTVYIKTPTQTFCTRYEFVLVDGHIYYKSRPPYDEIQNWKLLTKTGLPNSKKRGFHPPKRIVEIASDADTILAFSDEGRMYQCYFEKMPVAPTKPFAWNDTFGWPNAAPLIQNDLVVGNRSWAIGSRRKDVLWYEDINGNQHHFGTMGIDTVYFLSKNGQEIRFADTGLPADFSHSILGPERGSFISLSLSASASTMFVINDAGEMYTRLADFDTLGCDPMFFKYTYQKEYYGLEGSDYHSNFTPWALPSEDWKQQPSIVLSGKARITSCITIFQNGHGNFARELRVAGISPDGETGFYYKNIADAVWKFHAAPITIANNYFLDNEAVQTGTGKRGARQEEQFLGSLWKNGIRNENLVFSIPDFPLSEGPCHLIIRYGNEEKTVQLFPVEIWTYLFRYNPGKDGTPKQFFVTLSVPPETFETESPEFRSILETLFKGKNLVLFSCRAEASQQYFLLEVASDKKNSINIFLTKNGSPYIEEGMFRRLLSYDEKLVAQYLSTDLILQDGQAEISIKNRSRIEEIIKRNKDYREKVRARIRMYDSYKHISGVSRWGYAGFDFLTTVTMLNKIDFPKIRTMTSFGKDIMTVNAESYRFTAESHEGIYAHLIELIDLRINEYENIIREFDKDKLTGQFNQNFRDTFTEYFQLIHLPEVLKGTSSLPEYPEATLQRIDMVPTFPGLILKLNNGKQGDAESGIYFLVELKHAAKIIYSRQNDNLETHPFKTEVRFHILANTTETSGLNSISDETGRIEWNGSELKLWYRTSYLSKKLLFAGTIEPDSQIETMTNLLPDDFSD